MYSTWTLRYLKSGFRVFPTMIIFTTNILKIVTCTQRPSEFTISGRMVAYQRTNSSSISNSVGLANQKIWKYTL